MPIAAQFATDAAKVLFAAGRTAQMLRLLGWKSGLPRQARVEHMPGIWSNSGSDDNFA